MLVSSEELRIAMYGRMGWIGILLVWWIEGKGGWGEGGTGGGGREKEGQRNRVEGRVESWK